MEFRWLILCDKNGVKTEPLLQYRYIYAMTDMWSQWNEVPTVEMKDWEYVEDE